MKTSIRFFNNREVRAVWNESGTKWFFSALDVIGAINDESDYQKTRNYWKYLKAKLKKEASQLVSATTQLKLRAPDGKLRLTDASALKTLLNNALTSKIKDREMFMKGIDYSYYYEEGE